MVEAHKDSDANAPRTDRFHYGTPASERSMTTNTYGPEERDMSTYHGRKDRDLARARICHLPLGPSRARSRGIRSAEHAPGSQAVIDGSRKARTTRRRSS